MEEEPFDWDLISDKVDGTIEFKVNGTDFPEDGNDFWIPEGANKILIMDTVILVKFRKKFFELIKEVEEKQRSGVLQGIRFALPDVVEYEELNGGMGDEFVQALNEYRRQRGEASIILSEENWSVADRARPWIITQRDCASLRCARRWVMSKMEVIFITKDRTLLQRAKAEKCLTFEPREDGRDLAIMKILSDAKN